MKLKRLTSGTARATAKATGERYYRAEGPCRYGHTGLRYTSYGSCVECSKQNYANGSRHASDGPTHVYVFSTGEHVKVGIAGHVESRLKVARTHCPSAVSLIHTSQAMPRSEARAIEEACHTRLSNFKVHGEWFRCTEAQALAAIEAEEVFA